MIGNGYGAFWRSRKRYRVCKGSLASKKSKTAGLNRIHRILKYPECNYLCIRRFSNTLRDSIYADTIWAINQFGLAADFDYTTSPLKITYRKTGQVILFRGLDEGTKVTSITVPKGVLNFVDIEEAYEISEKDFEKLEMSIRGQVPKGYFKQITLIFNPWSALSWLKARFFDKPNKNVDTFTTTYRCNEWLDDSDRAIFEDMKINNPRRFAIEGNAEWGIATGRIYTKVKQDVFDVDEVRAIPGIKAAFNLDFGFTDPNAFVGELVDVKNKKIYIFDEWYKTGVTNQIIAQQIKDMGYGGQKIVCDSAEPKSIQELKEAGIKAVPSRKGADSVNHGIQLIQNFEIIVHPKCVEFWKEIQNYCWELDKDGKPTDRPEHEFSHGMDSMRYGITKIMLADVYSW